MAMPRFHPAPANAARRNWASLLPLLIVLLTAAVYANTLQVPFHFDDVYYIAGNPTVKNFRYYYDGELVRRAISQEYLDQNFLTRRLTFLSFALNYRLHRLQLPGYHIVNTLIHLANGLLVYWLVLTILQTPFFRGAAASIATARSAPAMALAAALAFIAHPVQTQAVTYTCQRFTSLSALFCLTALTLYGRWRLRTTAEPTGTSRKTTTALYGFSLAAALAAMLTKEIAFTLPLLIVLYEGTFFGLQTRRRALLLLPFLLTMLVIPLLVFFGGAEYTDIRSLKDSLTVDQPGNPALTYLCTQFRVLITYLRLLILPVNQHFDYDYPQYTSLFQAPAMLSFLLLCIIAGTGALLLRKAVNTCAGQGPWYRLISFGIFWFFLALSVESSIVPLKDVIFEHRLYLPSVGFFLVLIGVAGIILQSPLRIRGPQLLAASLFVIFILAIAAHSRNTVWQDVVVQLEDNVRKSPGKARPHVILADEYFQRGRHEDARREYTAGLQVATEITEMINGHTGLENVFLKLGDNERRSQNFQTYLGKLEAFQQNKNSDQTQVLSAMGVVYGKLGQWDKAETLMREVIRLEPESAIYRMSLGRLLLSRHRLDEAQRVMTEALRLHPENELIHEALGDVLAARGDQEGALQAYAQTQNINPDLEGIYRKIAQLYVTLGKLDAAVAVLWQEAAAGHADATLYKSLGNLYEQLNQFAEAERVFGQAVRFDGDNAMAHKNMGDFYLRRGQFIPATQYLQQAAALDPNNHHIFFNLGYALAEQRKYPEAINAYRQVLLLSPADEEARERLAQLQKRNADGN